MEILRSWDSPALSPVLLPSPCVCSRFLGKARLVRVPGDPFLSRGGILSEAPGEDLAGAPASVPFSQGFELRVPANLYLHIEDSDDSHGTCIATERKSGFFTWYLPFSCQLLFSFFFFFLFFFLQQKEKSDFVLLSLKMCHFWACLIHFVQLCCSEV